MWELALFRAKSPQTSFEPPGVDRPTTAHEVQALAGTRVGPRRLDALPREDHVAVAASLYAEFRTRFVSAVVGERRRLAKIEQFRLARGWKPRPEGGLEEWCRVFVRSGFVALGAGGDVTLPWLPEVPMLGRIPVHPAAHLSPRLEFQPPARLPPDARVAYPDGSAATRPSPRAGFGVVVVTGGDGVMDTAAAHLVDLYGPVVLDRAAPQLWGIAISFLKW